MAKAWMTGSGLPFDGVPESGRWILDRDVPPLGDEAELSCLGNVFGDEAAPAARPPVVAAGVGRVAEFTCGLAAGGPDCGVADFATLGGTGGRGGLFGGVP